MNGWDIKRIRLITVGFLIFAIILVSKLYLVQIVYGDEYRIRADRQYLRPTSNTFDRGSILFETKDGKKIAAATLRTGYTIAINPSLLEDVEGTYEVLSKHIELDKERFIERGSRTEDPYEEIAKRVPTEVAEMIEDLELTGVSVYKDRWRFYPGESLAAHTIGFISFADDDSDQQKGRYGLERYYEDVLSRENKEVYVNFFAELFSNISETFVNRENIEGDILTTIEPSVQSYVEDTLQKLHEDWNSRESGIIVMDPRTGEIRALGVAPTFDINEFNKVEDYALFGNPLIENVYEMGSIVKPLTMAIGLDTNKVTPETTYNDTGSVTLDTATFYNYDKQARGVVSMQEVLNQSLNTGVAFVVQKVGNKEFSHYMKKLIGSKTGIDLPNEVPPLVNNLDSPRNIEHATASFGQGIAMSPIVITRALAALGNGGILVQPHIVKKIDYTVGFADEINHEEPERIFSEKTSEDISRMLVAVVDDALADGKKSLPNYTVAAKTGTAQIANPQGGYYSDRFLHSFFGYFPAYDPQFIVFLYTVEPKGVQYASQTLTDPFFDVTKFLINYYTISPDR